MAAWPKTQTNCPAHASENLLQSSFAKGLTLSGLVRHITYIYHLYTQGLQAPSQKVLGPSKPTPYTFLEGTWSPRDHENHKDLRVIVHLFGRGSSSSNGHPHQFPNATDGTAIGLPPAAPERPPGTTPTDRYRWQSHGASGNCTGV